MDLARPFEEMPRVGELGAAVEAELHLRAAGDERAEHARVSGAAAVGDDPCRFVDGLVGVGQRAQGGPDERARPRGDVLDLRRVRGEEAIDGGVAWRRRHRSPRADARPSKNTGCPTVIRPRVVTVA